MNGVIQKYRGTQASAGSGHRTYPRSRVSTLESASGMKAERGTPHRRPPLPCDTAVAYRMPNIPSAIGLEGAMHGWHASRGPLRMTSYQVRRCPKALSASTRSFNPAGLPYGLPCFNERW